ncbi:MAG: hypothetical protein EXS31_16205 [Pedosphaera sp.]|nr:hypothetical protein [Pedosphaera sp.]
MQRLMAMAWLTLKAAYRYKLIWVLTAILIGGVVILPLIIKDDGTARGFTQILLTYTLALTTGILGFTTLWMACSTLARDVEECQIQVVAVKPIARWQIWMGKYIGIMALNALLLTLAGTCIYFLLQSRSRNLPEKQRELLRNEVLVARAEAREPSVEADIERETERVFQQRQKNNPQANLDWKFVRNQVREQVRAVFQVVRPGFQRVWKINLGFAKNRLADEPLFLRIKFNAADGKEGATYLGLWEVGEQTSPRLHREMMSLAADTFHEFKVPAHLLDKDGNLLITFINRNETALLFPLDDGMEVLYREGSFGLNFARGLCIILCWLSFLAAIGLAASSYLSFPVASFVSVGVLIVGFSSGTISQVIEQGTIGAVNHETGVADQPAAIDFVALPVFKSLLKLIQLVEGFSPIDALSSGRSISWLILGQAFFQICVVLGGIICLAGIGIFQRRELATAQGTS